MFDALTSFNQNRIAYGFFTTATQFVFPFLTIIACYTTIILKLRKRPSDRRCQFHQDLTSCFHVRRSQERKKTLMLDCLFALLVFALEKVACKHVGEINSRSLVNQSSQKHDMEQKVNFMCIGDSD
jgi:hypothetical protein